MKKEQWNNQKTFPLAHTSPFQLFTFRSLREVIQNPSKESRDDRMCIVVRCGGQMMGSVFRRSRLLYFSRASYVTVGIQLRRVHQSSSGDQEKLSVGTPKSSSTVTAVSGSDGEVVGRRSVRTGETRRWRTSTVRKSYDE
ncbi:hypothetical protein EVAR_63731_1 [Eumeta japonica]|uniref:Uncharacterized protein n=1 Tax=Eumeta variegata TaxID=151549 RepID=A0A4C1ZDT2_EUMVA|nr:hypothetical protein EVAR_63731_1 [Eumeta japonica]